MPFKYNPLSGELDLVTTDMSAATGTLAVANGGTGATSLSDGHILVGNGTSAIQTLDMTTKGVIIVGDGTTEPTVLSVGSDDQVLTADSGEASGVKWAAVPDEFTWNEETGTSATMAVNNGYIANNASLVTLTLPDTAALGDVVKVVGKGAGLFKIGQNASEIIHFIATDTTTGTGGSITAQEQYAAIELVCTVADTEWTVISSVGNFTIV